MKPPNTSARIMPACTHARGRFQTLYRGRDAGTRYAPPPPPAGKSMAAAARAAAARI